MTQWLECQEKILHHVNYVKWRCKLDTGTLSDSESMVTDSTGSTSSSISRWEILDMACLLIPKMTRHPTHRNVFILEISSPNIYGTVDFEAALRQFVAQFQNLKLTRHQIEDASYDIHLPFYSLPVFHKIKFWNEEFYRNVTIDSIHAYLARIKDNSVSYLGIMIWHGSCSFTETWQWNT